MYALLSRSVALRRAAPNREAISVPMYRSTASLEKATRARVMYALLQRPDSSVAPLFPYYIRCTSARPACYFDEPLSCGLVTAAPPLAPVAPPAGVDCSRILGHCLYSSLRVRAAAADWSSRHRVGCIEGKQRVACLLEGRSARRSPATSNEASIERAIIIGELLPCQIRNLISEISAGVSLQMEPALEARLWDCPAETCKMSWAPPSNEPSKQELADCTRELFEHLRMSPR